MVERERILEAVYRAVGEVNLQLDAESRLEKAEDMVIAGESASLDSLGFLNLVLAAEGAVNDVCSPPINLAEQLMGEDGIPPTTLGDFVTLIVGLQEG
jgi:hypothetical protein